MKKLFNTNFVLLMQGQLVSQLGTQAFTIALVFWIKQQTESASLVGTILMTSLIPSILAGPLGATFADYYSRKRMLIICDVLSFVSVGSLFVLLAWFPDTKIFILVWLFVISAVLSVIKSFFTPAIQAAIPSIVHPSQVASANSINQVIVQASVFLGQGSGGVLYRIFGAMNLFLFDSLSYLFSAICALFIQIPQEIPEKAIGFKATLQELRVKTMEGFQYIWRDKGLRAMVSTASFLNFFISPILVMLPFYVEDYLQVSIDWYGFLIGAFGVGSVVGYVAASVLPASGKTRSYVIVTILILTALLVIVFGLTPQVYLNMLTLALIGLLLGYANISIITIIQLRTESAIRGRVLGNFITLTSGLMPISMGISGLVLDLLDKRVEIVLMACGIALLAGTMLSAFNRAFTTFLSYDIPTDEKNKITH